MYLLKQYLLLYKGLSNGLRSPPRGGSVRKATNEGNPRDRIDKGNLISMNGQWQYFSKIFTLLALIPRKTRVYTISCQFRCKICKTREKIAKTVLSLLWCFFLPTGRICSSSCSKTELGLRRKHVQYAGYG